MKPVGNELISFAPANRLSKMLCHFIGCEKMTVQTFEDYLIFKVRKTALSKDQESIQSSTTPAQGQQMGKQQNHN